MFFPVKNSKIQRCFAFLLISASVLTTQAVGQSGIPWEKDLEKAKTRAISEKKPLLLHFYGDSCPPCQLMERDVFPNADVIEKLNADFVAIKINVSQSPQLMTQYGVRGWPMDIFLSPIGEKLHERVGMTSASQFLGELTSVAAKCPKPQSVQQSYDFPNSQEPRNTGIALAEYNQPGMPQSTNPGRPTDFSGFSVTQTSSFRQSSPSNPEDSEGYAVSGQGKVLQGDVRHDNAHVAAQIRQLQAALDSMPNHQAAEPLASQPFAPSQFMPQPVSGEQQFAATSPFQPTVPQQVLPQQMVPRQTVEPQPAGPILNSSPLIAVPSAAPMTSAGSFENGVIRKQPAAGMGAGNSLGVVAAVSDAPPMVPVSTVALDGYCPVSLAQSAKWVRGDAEVTTEYEGVLFRFVSVEARDTFANNPGLYAPVLRGNDAVELLTNRREAAGQRKFGAWYHGQVFLFTSAENYEKFQNNPELYAFQSRPPTGNAIAIVHSPMQ